VSFLLDTNVLSESTRPRPDPAVLGWLADADEDRVHLSVASIAELRFGIALLDDGARKERLSVWLTDELIPRFEGRVLDITTQVAHTWGEIKARARRSGVALTVMDAFLASTAAAYELTLVTRNVKDYSQLGVALLNPWNPL
jgi:predicted nucleic acid-binding protein